MITSHVRLDGLVLDVLLLCEIYGRLIAAGFIVVTMAKPKRLDLFTQLHGTGLKSSRAIQERCQPFERACVVTQRIFFETLGHLWPSRQVGNIEYVFELKPGKDFTG